MKCHRKKAVGIVEVQGRPEILTMGESAIHKTSLSDTYLTAQDNIIIDFSCQVCNENIIYFVF